jgi:hypothetical protein
LAGFVGFFGASVKQFSSGVPHSREFGAMASRAYSYAFLSERMAAKAKPAEPSVTIAPVPQTVN